MSGFTYPFRYVPTPSLEKAARELIALLEALPAQLPEKQQLSKGKMLGVLLTDRGPLYAFSGTLGGRSRFCFAGGDGCRVEFAPLIYDWTAGDGYFRKREAEISAMPAGPARSLASAQLQEWLFDHYVLLNAEGGSASIREIFAARGHSAPGGTGDCAAPKLLQQAYLRGWNPIAMGEFWYGASPVSEVREQGRFYPACMGKCGPVLDFMMRGLDVDPNPLDAEFTRHREPELLYADEDIIVVSKPAGMLSVPGRIRAVSLLERLRERFGPSVESCHRLDMDTSGVMVFARNPESKVSLEQQFAFRTTDKYYRARLSASPLPFTRPRKATIALPLSADYYDRPRQIVDFESGKLAVTEYEVLEQFPDGEIDVLFHPLTGRTHQLRVHAAHSRGLGRPIKGDCLYGAPSGCRLFLHAETLAFCHPRTGQRMSFSSPIKRNEL